MTREVIVRGKSEADELSAAVESMVPKGFKLSWDFPPENRGHDTLMNQQHPYIDVRFYLRPAPAPATDLQDALEHLDRHMASPDRVFATRKAWRRVRPVIEAAAALASPAGVTVAGDAEPVVCEQLGHAHHAIHNADETCVNPRPAPVEGAGAHTEPRNAAPMIYRCTDGIVIDGPFAFSAFITTNDTIEESLRKHPHSIGLWVTDAPAPEPAPTVTPAAVREAIAEMERYFSNRMGEFEADDNLQSIPIVPTVMMVLQNHFETIRAAAEAWAAAQISEVEREN